ncbi:hypothetical protein RHMOL_Rhmol06G0180200 [Rhododendron molle]|uniref:Uncharacterized protein n=1 Tax=Rhododendron molle TaxID=49168 RepID=A0ACC0NER4_RHOML|nr:hypothetical protein RHMOL_Rhmol06G0180200 [Rhododendron molle]
MTFAEYGMGNEVSPYGDVYSFGILLLEMFIGKRPTDNTFTNGLTLHNLAEMALPEQVENICNPTLFPEREMGKASSSIRTTHNHSSSSTHKTQECLVSILKIGVVCSHDLATNRMDIKDVVNQLHAIKNTMLRSGAHRGRSTRIVG